MLLLEGVRPTTEEALAAEKYLEILATDPAARARYLAAGHDYAAVAAEIAAATGVRVEASNLEGIAAHLMGEFADRVDELARTYPTMNIVLIRKS